MSKSDWRIWNRDDSVELRTYKRATGELPEMESTKQLVRLLEPLYRPGMSVLDVGCAAGHYLRGLRRLDPDIRYRGVDATKAYVDFATRQFADVPNASFAHGDVFDLAASANGPHDIVYCCNVILHLPSAERPIRNLVEASSKHVLIRTLVSDRTHLSKLLYTDSFDADGEPTDFVYQNTYSFDLIRRYVKNVGDYDVRFVADEFEPAAIDAEFKAFGERQSAVTHVKDGLQIAGSKVFEWVWTVITK